MVELTNKYFRVEGIACNLDLQLRKAYPVNEISYEYIPDIKPSEELHQAINNELNTPFNHSLSSPVYLSSIIIFNSIVSTETNPTFYKESFNSKC